MNRRPVWAWLGGVCVCLSAAMVVAGLTLWSRMVAAVAKVLSPDGVIAPQSEWRMAALYGLAAIAVFGVGYVALRSRDDAYRARLAAAFFEDRLGASRPRWASPSGMMMISVTAGLVAIVLTGICAYSAGLYTLLYDRVWGIFDIFSPVAALTAGVLLAMSALAARRTAEFSEGRLRWIPYFWLGVAVLLWFWTGEERSWGQDFFHWGTPELFAGNTENQTNVHNFFNPYFVYFYGSLAVLAVIVVVGAWLNMVHTAVQWHDWVLPHPSLLGLTVLIAAIALVFYWRPLQELLELLVAQFAVLYAIRALLIVRALPRVET